MPRYANIRTAVPCALLSILLGSLSLSASAVETGDVVKKTVRFADLNLTRSAGVAALYSRIELAAEEVCEVAHARGVDSITHAKRCKDRAIAQAVADVNVPLLTSYHLAQTKQTIAIAKR